MVGTCDEESSARLPFVGYDRSRRREICSEGMSACQHWRRDSVLEKQTIVHTPLRSWSVLSGGAAIVDVLGGVIRFWYMRRGDCSRTRCLNGWEGKDSASGIGARRVTKLL